MKTILVIANKWTTVVHFRLEVIEHLLKHGYRVIVALPVCPEAEPIRKLGCELVDIAVSKHGKNPFWELLLLGQCVGLIKKYTPDVVVTYTVKPNIYGSYACMLTKTPYINNVTGIGSILQKKSLLSSLLLKMLKCAFKKSACIFFQNRGNWQRLREEGILDPATPVDFTPGSGVNIDKFRYVPMAEADSAVRFVIVSRIRYDKGYAEFFDAAEYIKAKYPHTEFHVVGWYEDVGLHQRLDKLVENGIIVYHGLLAQEEVYQLVGRSTCLVHPSYHEGMANVILEAAATGRPVIASHIHGCQEAVEDGRTGFLCEVKSSQALIGAIEKFMGLSPSERVQMGLTGRRKMEREFDRKTVAEKLLFQIEKIVGKNK